MDLLKALRDWTVKHLPVLTGWNRRMDAGMVAATQAMNGTCPYGIVQVLGLPFMH